MDHTIGSMRAAVPPPTGPRLPAILAGSHVAELVEVLGSDKVQAKAKSGSLRALKSVGETLFPGAVAPTILVSGTITMGLGALAKSSMRQSVFAAGGYAASIVGGNLAYRAVHAVHGSDFAGKLAASAVGTAIGIGEAALLKRPASFISLLVNSIGANYGAGEAAKSISKHKP
jgi:hypothetical protein